MSTLEEIRARHDAIIPGPWRWMGNTATDQVYLGTVDRGRLYIMDTHTHVEQRVFHHDWCEGYSLEYARANVEDFCGAHDGDEDPPACRCEDIRSFLAGVIDPEEGGRQLDSPHMSRAAIVQPDLRFSAKVSTTPEHDAEALERRKKHGGREGMMSYRTMARYEVLGKLTDGYFRDYATRAENPNGNLYREDFFGLDNPEATFIENAPEDVAFLLEVIDNQRGMIDSQAAEIRWVRSEMERLETILAES